MPRHLETDVLIVGAGPTGLMVATCLARFGVRTVIIDPKSGPTRESRAIVLQARTMEILDQLGIVDRFLSEATVASEFRPGVRSRMFRPIQLTRLAVGASPYPHLYVLEQSRTERILGERLATDGRDISWGYRLESLAESGSGIRATASADGDTLTVSARYCVGADGSGSAVRTMLGVEFDGATNAHTFYVLDAVGVRGLALDSINVRLAARNFLLTFPMAAPDHERLLGSLPVAADAELLESTVRAMVGREFSVSYDSSNWFATYRVHHRVARRFRVGGVFLAGDAAHVHSPVGAQGMNTGLQDAHNLACKIADVMAGRRPDASLDRYESERRPVALRLVSTTDRMFAFVTSAGFVARVVRRLGARIALPVVTLVVPRFTPARRIFEYLAQIRIHYWMDSTAKERSRGKRGRTVGRRLPYNGDNFDDLRLMRWQLHAYGTALTEQICEASETLDLPVSTFPAVRNDRLVAGRLYLVRPDGFVAAESPPHSAVTVFSAAIRAR